MEEVKEINKIKEISKKDWEQIAKILVKGDHNKYKQAFNYLESKYKINFTYQNFYNWTRNHELMIVKDALMDKYYEKIEENVNDAKKAIEYTMKQLAEIKQKCEDGGKNVLKSIIFLDDAEKNLDNIKQLFFNLKNEINNLKVK